MVTVKVPATSANLGPGFDCLGLALSIYNEISFDESISACSGADDTFLPEGLCISGCPEKFREKDNLAYVSFVKTLESRGLDIPGALNINIRSDIPVSRGLGSSARLIVAGIAGADALHDLKLTKEEMLLIANSIEGHPDNAAPAIYGGLTAALIEEDHPVVACYSVNRSLRFTVLVPDFETSTEKARALLPENIKRTDAVYTVGRLGILLKSLETGDEEKLFAALNDRLHQPYRKELIPGFDDIREAALKNGAAGLVISGSGSTLLAVGGSEDFEAKMQAALSSFSGNWKAKTVGVDLAGAILV